jgi:hypothetical protein
LWDNPAGGKSSSSILCGSRVRGYWQQKIGSVLGLFTILLVVFAPLVSQTLRANDPAYLALSSFCSVEQTSHHGSYPEHAPSHGLNDEACAYCGLAAHFHTLPVAIHTPWRAPRPIVFAHAVTVVAFIPGSAPYRARPRGPPISI